MYRSKSFYCSCSTCTQIRNEQPKHYRYLHSLRELFTCSFCVPRRRIISEQSLRPIHSNRRLSTITFRDIDITNKHCSKHDVMVKASRPHQSKLQLEEIRQRVREANRCWTRMSILPVHLIEYIFDQKETLPLCSLCHENLSRLKFNLCHRCLRRIIYSERQIQSISTNPDEIQILSIQSDSLTSTDDDDDDAIYPLEEEIKQIFLDCSQGESMT